MWWKELVRVRNGIGFGDERWFEENLMRVVGDGVDTYFLSDLG